MGTYFSLTIMDTRTNNYIEVDEEIFEQIAGVLAAIIDEPYDSTEAFLIDMMNGAAEGKWYDHTEHMKTLAKLFPNYVFSLEGEGEEREDWWIEDYWGDRISRREAKIIPPCDLNINWK